TSYPCFLRFCSSDQRIRCSSSTTRIFIFLILNPLPLTVLVDYQQCSSVDVAGSSIVKTVPLPSSLSTLIAPPCCVTSLWQIASPSPVPCAFVVKNGVNILPRI